MEEGRRKPASISRPARTRGTTLGSTEHSTNHYVNMNTETKEFTVKIRRTLPKSIKILLWTFAGFVIVPLMLAIVIGTVEGLSQSASQPTGNASATLQISNFNDGFSTAKQDDCEQGFKPACQWLQENH